MNKYDSIFNQLNQRNDMDTIKLPERSDVISIVKLIQVILFPHYYHYENLTMNKAWLKLMDVLHQQLDIVIEDKDKIDTYVFLFLNKLPSIKKNLLTDIQAIYDGDPACKSKAEVIVCYPGFYAISIYRIAHELYLLKIPYISRIMTEFAHEKTGIDIHPGASIGPYFCIDHGTGIVIGETACIGHHVKLYQGVTIGAKSFDLDDQGHPIKGGKRHPDIGNHVVIYSNATILGGDTVIGNNSIIGGNTWLIESVPDNSKIYYK